MSYLVKFKVSGSGDFPLDMLRYDSCWPVESAPIRYEGRRTVELIGYCRNTPCTTSRGVPGEYPTFGRWASFLWSVDPDSVEVVQSMTERR